MRDNHDDNWGGKHGKSKDKDIDLSIDVNVDIDGERSFDKIHQAGGSAVGGHCGLNLCDVAEGISDVKRELSGGGNGGIFGGIRDGIRDGIHDGIRDGFHDGIRAAGGVIGKDASPGGLDFNPPKPRDGELPYIDCEWGRLLEQNKTDMLHRAAKIGAALKDTQG